MHLNKLDTNKQIVSALNLVNIQIKIDSARIATDKLFEMAEKDLIKVKNKLGSINPFSEQFITAVKEFEKIYVINEERMLSYGNLFNPKKQTILNEKYLKLVADRFKKLNKDLLIDTTDKDKTELHLAFIYKFVYKIISDRQNISLKPSYTELDENNIKNLRDFVFNSSYVNNLFTNYRDTWISQRDTQYTRNLKRLIDSYKFNEDIRIAAYNNMFKILRKKNNETIVKRTIVECLKLIEEKELNSNRDTINNILNNLNF